MTLIQQNLNIPSVCPREKWAYSSEIFSKERLEKIGKVAIGIIAITIGALYVYTFMKKNIESKLLPLIAPSDFENKVIYSFRSIGIHMEKIPEAPGEFRCSHASFVDIYKALEDLTEEDKEKIGEFYFNPQQRSICCNFNKPYSFQYPNQDNWMSLLRISRQQEVEPLEPLTLPHGSVWSEQKFVTDPLFRNTLEKYSVFKEIGLRQSTPNFLVDYRAFLDLIQSTEIRWAERYRYHPLDLAYLSLIAYLDEQITKEELFVAQMLASIFLESPGTAQFTVLSSENVRHHLKEYFYITQEHEGQNFYCLKNLDKKSLIARTAISFASKQNRERAAYTTITKRGGPNPPGVKIQNTSEAKSPVSLFILPSWLWKRLYSELFPEQSPPIEHEEFFGFRTRLNDLLYGRPISYASPLFYLPKVHSVEGTQVGVTVHDIMFHCFLDWRHPHAKALISLGQKTRGLGQEKQILTLAMAILDRNMMRVSNNLEKDVSLYLKQLSRLIKDLSDENQIQFFNFCFEVFGEGVINELFSDNTFDVRFRPQQDELPTI